MKRKPKPFTRPSIDLSGGVKRAWKHLPVCELEAGDQVAEFGEVKHKTSVALDEIIIESTLGRVERLPEGTMLHAYVKVLQES